MAKNIMVQKQPPKRQAPPPGAVAKKEPEPAKPSGMSSGAKVLLAFLILLIVAIMGYFIYKLYFGPAAKAKKALMVIFPKTPGLGNATLTMTPPTSIYNIKKWLYGKAAVTPLPTVPSAPVAQGIPTQR
jgi:hypothetical protein